MPVIRIIWYAKSCSHWPNGVFNHTIIPANPQSTISIEITKR